MALAICLVAPLGWIAQADAGTTATVEVTGQVVDTSLALTLTTTTFSLGDVDATGNSYDPVTSLAEPFPVGANPYLVPQGVAWVAKQAIQYTVTSPAMWVLRFCSTTESGTLDGSTVLLYMPGSRPPGFGDPVDYFGPNGVKACSSGYPNGVVAGPGINLPYSIYPTFVVRPTDTPRAFSATVQLTLSVFP
jgi:hypothetical protein